MNENEKAEAKQTKKKTFYYFLFAQMYSMLYII